MLRIIIEIRGLAEAQARLRAVSGTRLSLVLQRGLNRVAREVATAAKARAPYRKGDLRRAIFWEPSSDPSMPASAVVVPTINGVPYGLFVHEGTGIYGPRGAPIRPVRASVLRFEVPGGLRPTKSGKYRRGPSQVVYAPEVRGTPPDPFLLDAFESARAAGLVEKELSGTIAKALHGRADVEPAEGEGE